MGRWVIVEVDGKRGFGEVWTGWGMTVRGFQDEMLAMIVSQCTSYSRLSSG